MKRIVLEQHHDGTIDSQGHSATPASPNPEQPQPRTPTPSSSRQQRQRQTIPPELIEIVVPSLKVGAAAGACGIFAGATAGIIRSAPTVLFSAFAGVQWFTLGFSYYGARQVALNYFGGREAETARRDKLKASTVAGGFAGLSGGLLRGPRNILPGILMFSLYGAGGQTVLNWMDAKRAARAAESPSTQSNGFWSRWSPLKRLSDQDYEKILEERLLGVEADIAMVDDHIRELLESEKKAKGGSPGADKGSSVPPDRE